MPVIENHGIFPISYSFPPPQRNVTCWSLNIFQRGKNCRIWTTAQQKVKSKVFSGILGNILRRLLFLLVYCSAAATLALRMASSSNSSLNQSDHSNHSYFNFLHFKNPLTWDSRIFFFSPFTSYAHYRYLFDNPVRIYYFDLKVVMSRTPQRGI